MKDKTMKTVEGLNEEKKDYEFRLLDADEIECRVGQGGNNNATWCSLLLYKDARCDMKRLDEKFGIYGWQRKHDMIANNLYCTVSIYKEGIGWISKQDVGVPSNTESIKGQSSDAFKRACFCLGVGRELYTAPKIFIRLALNEYNKNGRLQTTFHVGYIGYTNRKVSQLIIQDQNNVVRYYYGMTSQEVDKFLQKKVDNGYSEPAPQAKVDESLLEQKNYAYPQLEQAQLSEEVDKIWSEYTELQVLEDFAMKCAIRKMQLSNTKEDLLAIYNAYPQFQQNKEFVQKLTENKNRL